MMGAPNANLLNLMDALADRMIAAVEASDAPDSIKKNRRSALELEKRIRRLEACRKHNEATHLKSERDNLEMSFLAEKGKLASGW
jgi:hypothetical protein